VDLSGSTGATDLPTIRRREEVGMTRPAGWTHRWSDRGTDYSIDEFGVVTEQRADAGAPPIAVLPNAVSRELARLAHRQRWIHFEEQRPEEDVYVVVFHEADGEAQTEAAFHHQWRAIEDTQEPLARTRRGRGVAFTHWRRLPEPPRPDDD
jgi:hypothetical protein